MTARARTETIVRETRASLDRLRELAAKLDDNDASAAAQLRKIEQVLRCNLAHLFEISRDSHDVVSQEAIDRLAEREISIRVAQGRSEAPLTAADVFAKYGLADPPAS